MSNKWRLTRLTPGDVEQVTPHSPSDYVRLG